jgi:hypothetical protein
MADNETFDYQANMREVPPDPTQIRRGLAERELRRATAMLEQSVRIDPATLEQFRQRAVNGQSCEQLINQALREWLSTDDMKDVLRAEIHAAVQQSLAGVQQQVDAASS